MALSGPAGTAGRDGTEPLPRGYRVLDWEVTEPIGAGGWADVYAGRRVSGGARDRHGGGRPAGPEEVALKFLPTAGLAPRQARGVAESARREVELGGGTGHPRLIRLLDFVVLSEPDRPSLDGTIVLIMERAACSLRDVLGRGVAEAEGARLVTGVCEGVAHLHRSGWVHGDLKPENVLLMDDGSVKLSDFGLAAELTGTHGYAPPMGTMDYLPPERRRAPIGERGVESRPSTDIWALGVLMHEVFASGVSPFPGATPMARAAAVQEYAEGRARLRTDGAVPPFWHTLIADCLAPTHAARAAHTAESLLSRIAAGPTVTDRAGRRPAPRRRRGVRGLLATGAVCAATAGGWWYTGPPGDLAGPVEITVFNAELACQEAAERDPDCSLGLAIDPWGPYTADNVVPTRVWHGDVLTADCGIVQGTPIIDEADRQSSEWIRVRLPSGSARDAAWLPAVRADGRPEVSRCRHLPPRADHGSAPASS
ncbi:serine/threonine-protein kinase [Streptomyces sp. NPDC002793]|uniref:serine/threonine-protein kinase n=1 Tax=Streptomyces sp. NPDC002793 TaxID=3154432 RepID=UPI00331DAAA0